jgi:hypothetical protein
VLSSCEKEEATPANLLLSTQDEVDKLNHSQIYGDLTISGEFISSLKPLDIFPWGETI